MILLKIVNEHKINEKLYDVLRNGIKISKAQMKRDHLINKTKIVCSTCTNTSEMKNRRDIQATVRLHYKYIPLYTVFLEIVLVHTIGRNRSQLEGEVVVLRRCIKKNCINENN